MIYDAEHFFDAFRDDPDYALRCLRAAAEAGAENVTLCDTNGSSLPGEVAAATARVVAELGDSVQVGIHTHDDAGCGVANSLVAVEAGARLVQGTMNGYGERCGNANLVSILPGARAEAGLRVDRARAPAAADRDRAPGRRDLQRHAEPEPALRGRQRLRPQGRHARGRRQPRRAHVRARRPGGGGRRPPRARSPSCRARAPSRPGATWTATPPARVVERVKELENRGYQFEAADGSFDLLIRKETGEYEPLFRLESWRAIVEKREDGRVETEATIKIWVDGERYVRTAEGNGPVHALDRALRAAIGERYPHLRDIELVNFKVRILDERKGTGAVTRVLLDASDGHDTWGSIGVSENIIEASWEALVDSLEAGMLPGSARSAGPADTRRPARSRERLDPARPAAGRRARGGAAARDAALAAGWRSGRGWPSSRRPSARRLGVGARVGRLERHRRACTWPSAPRGWRPATRSSPRRSASWPRPTACSTRTPGRSSATSTRAR